MRLQPGRLEPRVKLAGETRYRSGSTCTVVDEAFTWTRISTRKLYVYFQTIDDPAGKTRSTRISIPARIR